MNMTTRSRWTSLLISLFASAVFQACGENTGTGTEAPVATVTVLPANATIVTGGTQQFTAELRDSNGNSLSGRVVSWTSADHGVATVSSQGLAAGASVGSTTITATSEGKQGAATLSVSAIPTASVTVAPGSATIATGSTVQMTATARDAAGNVLPGRTPSWTSQDPGIASVDAAGLVTGEAAGNTSVTATIEGKSASAAIEVTAPAVSLAFSTFLGTAGSSFGSLREVTFDSQGDIIVAGMADVSPSGYPGVPVHTFGVIDNSSIIVAKLSPDGSTLRWVTLVGGTGAEKGGYGVDVDANDNIYVAGTTHSPDFPTTAGAFDRTPNNVDVSSSDAFVFKLPPDGSSLLYSTFLGGSDEESARGGLAVDASGFAYVVGSTRSLGDYLDNSSSGNPANKVNAPLGGQDDGFITKVAQDGGSIVFSRFVGGTDNAGVGGVDQVKGIRVNPQGVIYAAALINSTDAPTTDGSQHHGGGDIYFVRLSADGTQVQYASYFGGSGFDEPGRRIWLDGTGAVYLAGSTTSTDFPVVSAQQASYGGGAADAILVKVDQGGQVVFSTYVGGADADDAWGPGVDASGNIFVTGRTKSADFVTTPGAFDRSLAGDFDVFYRVYTPAGALAYSSFIGGTGSDEARFIKVSASGDPVLVGTTHSVGFPTTAGAYDTQHNGVVDLFAMKFDMPVP
jgi:hypothetical protein